MAEKNGGAGGNILIPAQAVICLIATVAPFGAAWGLSDSFAPTSYVGSADPNMVWEMLIGGIVVCSFLAAVALWILSALRKDKRLQLRRNAFVRSAIEQPQPWPGDGGCAATDHVLQRPLFRDLWPRAFGCSQKRDRPGAAGDAAQAWLPQRQRRKFLSTGEHAGRLHYRTARRAVGSGQDFCIAERRLGVDA